MANNIAKVWKNGVATALTDGSKTAIANAVYVSNGDIYVVGYENNGTSVAKVWKNGIGKSLTDGTKNAEARSVYVVGNDVYVAGIESNQGVVWKNGVASPISNSTTANSVYVANNNVYIAGFGDYSISSGSDVTTRCATSWKNGVATILSNIPSNATSVYVNGNNDVYVAGYDVSGPGGTTARVWKNGTALPLINSGKGSNANSVFVSGNDIYTAGNQAQSLVAGYARLATIWKNNGVTWSNDGPNDAVANSVFVSGNDVYVAGFQYSGTKTTIINPNYTINEMGRNIAQVWKNGIVTSLTDGTKEASANSVFVSGNDVYVAGFEAVSK